MRKIAKELRERVAGNHARRVAFRPLVLAVYECAGAYRRGADTTNSVRKGNEEPSRAVRTLRFKVASPNASDPGTQISDSRFALGGLAASLSSLVFPFERASELKRVRETRRKVRCATRGVSDRPLSATAVWGLPPLRRHARGRGRREKRHQPLPMPPRNSP